MISSKHTVKEAIEIAKKKRVYIEGNFVKLLADTSDKDVKLYIDECKTRDLASRRKRLEVTKQVQAQYVELEKAAKENESLVEQLHESLEDAQKARKEAEALRDRAVEDLDTLQKRTQFELINLIVRVALWVILGVGVMTTLLYLYVLSSDIDSTIIETTWSNLFGILLTNSFSIVGTIMGVKYATDSNK